MPILPQPDEPQRKTIDTIILELLARLLQMNSLVCQESAIHGLGHWATGYPKQVESIIDEYFVRLKKLREATQRKPLIQKHDALEEYAGRAKVGDIL